MLFTVGTILKKDDIKNNENYMEQRATVTLDVQGLDPSDTCIESNEIHHIYYCYFFKHLLVFYCIYLFSLAI